MLKRVLPNLNNSNLVASQLTKRKLPKASAEQARILAQAEVLK